VPFLALCSCEWFVLLSCVLLPYACACDLLIFSQVIKIPTVRYFALFAATLVVTNFLLCITFYFCALILWERYLRPCGCRNSTPSKATPNEVTN